MIRHSIRHSIRRVVLTGVLLVGLGSAALLGQESKSSYWTGTLNAGGTKLRLNLTIETKRGKLQGELLSIDQGNQKLAMSDVKLDDKGLSFSLQQIQASYEGEVQKDGSVKGFWSQGPIKLPLSFKRTRQKPAESSGVKLTKSDETLKEAWIGKLQVVPGQPLMQFRIVTSKSGETSAFFDSVTEGRTGFAATWSIEDQTLKFDVKQIGLKYRGTLDEKKETAEGTWSQGGRDFPLTLKKQAKEYENTFVWENRPQRPREPFPYDSETVIFENKADGIKLAGTLTIPKSAGRHPAVILISGSGPQDRDETLMGHKPFLVLADYLTRRGIAVLRYDDRGTAGSGCKFNGVTSGDFARDTSAAVDFLKQQPRIDPRRIGLVGHSEGGLIAPIVATSRDDLAAIVLMAGPGVSGETIGFSQSEAMARAAGADEEAVAFSIRLQKRVFEIVKRVESNDEAKAEIKKALEELVDSLPADQQANGKEIQSLVEGQLSRMTGPWFRFFLNHDPANYLAKVKCPVLALNGEKDLQVLADLNLNRIEETLKAAGHPDFKIVKLAGLNHLFQACETGSMSEYASIQETFNPKALETIGDWIVDHLKPENESNR